MSIEDLAGRLFVGVPEAANILGADVRTIRRAAAAGEIPCTRVGARYAIPTAWLCARAEYSQADATTQPEPDLDQLADRVAELLLTKLARKLGSPDPDMPTAGPAPPGPAAATAADPLPRKERSHDHHTAPA